MVMITAPDWPWARYSDDQGLCGDVLMSNYDGEINEDVAEALRSGQYLAEYTGWNFHATCWFADGLFHAEVSVYHVHRATISAETPAKLMKAVSEAFGYE
jgi:hypothetical protein